MSRRWKGRHFRGTPVASLPPAPPTVWLVLSVNGQPAGPLLPLCGGAQAPGNAFPFHLTNRYKNIAILLIIKGIAIAFVNLFDYICVALK